MGLSSFDCAAEGLLPQLLMNTVLLVVLVKKTVQSLLVWKWSPPNSSEEGEEEEEHWPETGRERRVSITWYKPWWERNSECCVCLCGFEAEEEVSELACKHLFHEACLAKWFRSRRSTCPLCRSVA